MDLRLTRCAGAVLALVAAAGCSGPPVLHQRTVALVAGPDGFAEVNLLMDANATIAWTWTIRGGDSTYFDVHSHTGGPGGPVVEHVYRAKATQDAGSFAAPTAGSYSLLWENTGAGTLSLDYKVTGQARLDPQFPPVP